MHSRVITCRGVAHAPHQHRAGAAASATAPATDIDPVLFRLLAAVREHGRLTAATREVGYSYRHCWNMIRDWSEFFGAPLVDLTRGRGARLAPLGEALTWAVERVQARLGPQLHNLAQEIDREINRAVLATEPTVRVAASHGYAVALLPELVAAEGGLRLELNYLNSIDAVAAMVRGQADVAGFHIPIGRLAGPLFARYGRWLKTRSHAPARPATRAQGLMLAPGDPHRHPRRGRPGAAGCALHQPTGRLPARRPLLDAMLEQDGDRTDGDPRLRRCRVHPRGGGGARRQRPGRCRLRRRGRGSALRASISSRSPPSATCLP
jgi:molybdate transport repressor ModE-like protein